MGKNDLNREARREDAQRGRQEESGSGRKQNRHRLSLLDKWRRTRLEIGLLTYFRLHPWGPYLLLGVALSGASLTWYLLHGTHLRSGWAKSLSE